MQVLSLPNRHLRSFRRFVKLIIGWILVLSLYQFYLVSDQHLQGDARRTGWGLDFKRSFFGYGRRGLMFFTLQQIFSCAVRHSKRRADG